MASPTKTAIIGTFINGRNAQDDFLHLKSDNGGQIFAWIDYTGKLQGTFANTGVTSLNTLTGDITVAAGTGIGVSTVGQTITVASTGLTSLNTLTGDVTIAGGTGVTIGVVGQTITVNGLAAGGSSGQLEYNNAGVLGGVGTSSFSGNILTIQSATSGAPVIIKSLASGDASLYITDCSVSPYTTGLVNIVTNSGTAGLAVEVPSAATSGIVINNTTANALGALGLNVTDSGFAQLECITPSSGTGILRINNKNMQFNPATGTTGGAFSVVNPAGSTIFSLSVDTGTITEYNGINTVNNGVASEVAAVNSTGLSAAVGTTTLYTTTATGGLLRLDWSAKVTTADGVSSTLGALTIVYTDPDSVVQSLTAGALTEAGTVATTATGDSTTTALIGIPLFLNCKASTNVTYAMAYTSNTPGNMQYNLHIALEKL